MIAFPHCKINLGLQVIRKRSDGFHDIATVFYPVPLRDVLEVLPAPNSDTGSLHLYGLPVNGAAADNLCTRAWLLLKTDFPSLPAVHIHLLKNIPLGAGLGGGSADGAFMLQLLNDTFHLELSSQQLIGYAAQLGSDCPFFIINQPCFATGRGEVLKPVKIDLTGYQLLLIHPPIHISTGWAFSQLNVPVTGTLKEIVDMEAVIAQPIAAWRDQVGNDFETPVFDKYPAIRSLKRQLYETGALYASMSGSGSSVFGIFDKDFTPAINLPEYSRLIRL